MENSSSGGESTSEGKGAPAPPPPIGADRFKPFPSLTPNIKKAIDEFRRGGEKKDTDLFAEQEEEEEPEGDYQYRIKHTSDGDGDGDNNFNAEHPGQGHPPQKQQQGKGRPNPSALGGHDDAIADGDNKPQPNASAATHSQEDDDDSDDTDEEEAEDDDSEQGEMPEEGDDGYAGIVADDMLQDLHDGKGAFLGDADEGQGWGDFEQGDDDEDDEYSAVAREGVRALARRRLLEERLGGEIASARRRLGYGDDDGEDESVDAEGEEEKIDPADHEYWQQQEGYDVDLHGGSGGDDDEDEDEDDEEEEDEDEDDSEDDEEDGDGDGKKKKSKDDDESDEANAAKQIGGNAGRAQKQKLSAKFKDKRLTFTDIVLIWKMLEATPLARPIVDQANSAVREGIGSASAGIGYLITVIKWKYLKQPVTALLELADNPMGNIFFDPKNLIMAVLNLPPIKALLIKGLEICEQAPGAELAHGGAGANANATAGGKGAK